MGSLSYKDEQQEEAVIFCERHLNRPFRRSTVTKDEWLFLYDIVRDLRPSKMIEIGCYLYTSSLAFLKAMDDELSDALFYSIDPIHNRGRTNLIDGMPHFWYGKDSVDSRWFRIIAKSQDILTHMNDKFGLIYIDGDHEAPAVKKDFENALRLIEPGGVIIIHDVCSKDLKKAITEVRPEEEFEWYEDHMDGDHCKGFGIYRR